MASSMINGERRWAATRRSGMTVLGKVAVPKPVNLPSQKLENHGLDPNVEIVPKGTLSWGSRPSSSGSNAWGSSVLSPKADGSNASPSHISSRPSSSGGTRPSTAGSEKAHDSIPNAWGSNLRPSSASGPLMSSHTSLTSLRPRSAETRPGSSQLSRFAEPIAENSGPQDAAAGSAEKSRITSSVNDRFSLSSGDFPTLGSDNESSRKNHVADGRPRSPSGKLSSVTEHTESTRDAPSNAEVKGGISTNSWRNNNPQNDGPRPVMERWHREPHPYQNPNVPSHHYESWHGAPGVNAPAGWLRGPQVAPPYGGPVPPGGFPMEPFPYFRPQVAPPVLPNPHTVPSHGPGQHGPHPKNGDFYRPHVGDSYGRPAMPMRPGFYPGPMAYDGYYGPPMGYCNPNERDLPFMGMPPGPPMFNRHPNPNAADPSNSHGRSTEARAPEQAEFGPDDSRGSRKALTQQDNGWNKNNEEGKWGDRSTNNAASGKQRDLPPPMLRESAWGNDEKNDRTIYKKGSPGEEASAQSLQSGSGHANLAVQDLTPMTDAVASSRDHALIQKIEGLNAKVRASDGKHDPVSGFNREEQHKVARLANVMPSHLINEAGRVVVYLERPRGAEAGTASATVMTRASELGVLNRGTHVKGRVHGQDMDGWHKKNPPSVSSNISSGATSGTSTDAQDQENTLVPSKGNNGGRDDVLVPGFDDTQRAKMKEIAKQRAIQLQKEEEERVREQKAKALAKLEELNRRSAYQVKEDSNQKVELPGCAKGEVPEEQPTASLNSRLSAPASSLSSNAVAASDDISNRTFKSPVPSLSFGTVSSELLGQDFVSVLAPNQPLPAAQDALNDGNGITPQPSKSSLQKWPSYKQKQNATLEKNSAEKLMAETSVDLEKKSTAATAVTITTLAASQQVVVNDTGSASESSMPIESQFPGDSSTSNRKRNNRNAKNKHKHGESFFVVSPSGQKESHLEKDVPTDAKLDTSENKLDHSDVTSSIEKTSSVSQEDGQGIVNQSGKQHPRVTHRHAQASRTEKSHSNDSIVWAPIRAQGKIGPIDNNSSQRDSEAAISSTKPDQIVQSSSKSKRAEMERYVPKQVAKEMAQQGSTQLSTSPSTDQVNADGMNRKTSAGLPSVENSARSGIAADSRNVNGNKSRQTKVSWRQRGNAESSTVQVPQDDSSSSTTNVNKKAVMSFEPEETLKPPPSKYEDPAVTEQTSIPDEGNGVDGWVIYEEPINNSQAKAPALKDHGAVGRGKRNSNRGGYKGGQSNYKPGSRNTDGADDSHHPIADTVQTDRPVSSKENRAAGDRGMPNWQPKSQPYATKNFRGNRSSGGESFDMDARLTSKRETFYQRDVDPPQQQDPNDEVPAVQNERREDARGQRKFGPVRSRSHYPSQGDAEYVEPVPARTMGGHSQQRPTGFRRHGNYNSHFNRAQESHGDRSSNMHDPKQQFIPGDRGRLMQDSHYEYQPVGPYTNNRSSFYEGQMKDEHAGPRFREKGQGQPRRGGGTGNFHGRPRANAHVDGSYE
ncbi:MODIFIER OF SNC1 1-like protein [Drosera capensis]